MKSKHLLNSWKPLIMLSVSLTILVRLAMSCNSFKKNQKIWPSRAKNLTFHRNIYIKKYFRSCSKSISDFLNRWFLIMPQAFSLLLSKNGPYDMMDDVKVDKLPTVRHRLWLIFGNTDWIIQCFLIFQFDKFDPLEASYLVEHCCQ